MGQEIPAERDLRFADILHPFWAWKQVLKCYLSFVNIICSSAWISIQWEWGQDRKSKGWAGWIIHNQLRLFFSSPQLKCSSSMEGNYQIIRDKNTSVGILQTLHPELTRFINPHISANKWLIIFTSDHWDKSKALYSSHFPICLFILDSSWVVKKIAGCVFNSLFAVTH